MLFYDSVAAEYDEQMRSNSINERIRERMASYFQAVVKGKYIMDFGGGTGADLNWLTENMYRVCFCEPSVAMRTVAMALNDEKIKNQEIQFLGGDQADFRQWDSNTFPKKFDAVLANFCVLNSIDDMSLLFEKLASVIDDQGHVIALLLDTTYSGILKSYLKNFISAFFRNKYPRLVIQHAGNKHTVYLHTPAKIMQAVANHFSCKELESLSDSGFMIVHLQKLDYAAQ